MAKVKLRGLNQLVKKLEKRPGGVLQLTAAAINIEANVIMAEAVQLTPVDLGTLRASGFIAQPRILRTKMSVQLGFGGPAAPYALFVHEDLTANHTTGQAKFLEQPFKARLQGMSRRIAERVERGLT